MAQSILPFCLQCRCLFEELKDPVLLPCSHYILCQGCCQSEITCPNCDALLTNPVPNAYLSQLSAYVRNTLSQGGARLTAEEEIRPALQAYLSQSQSSADQTKVFDLRLTALKSVSEGRSETCGYCLSRKQSTGIRCSVCNRVDFGGVEYQGDLPQSILTLFHSPSEAQNNAVAPVAPISDCSDTQVIVSRNSAKVGAGAEPMPVPAPPQTKNIVISSSSVPPVSRLPVEYNIGVGHKSGCCLLI